MRSFLTILRDGTASPRLGSDLHDLIAAPDRILPDAAAAPEGRVVVENLIASLDRDESLREFRPLIILTAGDLVKSGCASLFGYADCGRQIGVVSTYRLEHPDSALTEARLKNVISHEIGHLYGRRHCRHPGCLMHPATTPEDLDGRMSEPCARCSRRGTGFTAILNRTSAALFLILTFVGANLAATLTRTVPLAPFAAAVGSSELLVFNGTPLNSNSSLVDPVAAPEELNRLFTMLDPPPLSVRAKGGGEASIHSGDTELLRVRHNQAETEAGKLTARLNELLEAKGNRSSLCAECHLERKDEVLEAAHGRKWGVGPF